MAEIWQGYYDRFKDISPSEVREGCHPLIMDFGGEPQENAIVLIHGLTDSPHYMQAIGEYFHEILKFNVFIPLLQGHGLKNPNGMKGVSLEQWKENVKFAIKIAQQRGKKVSIGGLSTGGALSVYMATEDSQKISGAIFLFSAALDIAGKTGNFVEQLLRTPIANLVDLWQDKSADSLIGDNPYRYSRMDVGGAQELSELIKDVDELTGRLGKKNPLKQPLFVAHSEADQAADIEGVEELIMKSRQSEFFRMGQDFNISHASVVLKDHVMAENGSPLEAANPFFNEMMNLAGKLVEKVL
ncbi:MAG: alpha/beta hydrolase [Microcystaceae cyanobacterium]